MQDDSSPRTLHNLASMAWAGVILLAAATYALVYPLELVLGPASPAALSVVRRVLLLLFTLDVPVRFVQARRSGRGKRSRSLEAALVFDVVAALPVVAGPEQLGLAALGLAKLATVAAAMHEWRQRAPRYAGLLGLGFTAFWLILVMHGICAGWLLLRGLDQDIGLLPNYVDALYWAVVTLATVGYGDITPDTTAQRIFAIATVVIGLSFIGYLIGLMASYLAQRDPGRAIYNENMDRLSVAVRHRRIPGELERKIVDYYAYAWRQRRAYDESEFLASLPSTLRREVAVHMKRDVLEQVELFHGADPEFVRYVALRLHPEVLTPGDWVFREGDKATCMYFITRGELEVLRQGGSEPVARLGAGDFFGEIALFEDEARTASVRAVGYCDLYALSKAAFEQVVARFPDSVRAIEVKARNRISRDAAMEGDRT